MRNPAVSVLMAVRDCERFVGAAVQSVLNQTLSDLELIVVDDASQDSTPQVVESFNDPRIRLVRGNGNGSGAARNIALRDSMGALIAFLDGDDVWDARHLDVQVAALAANSDVDLVFSLSRFIDQTGRPMRVPMRKLHGRFGFASLLRDNVCGNGSAVIARREAIPDAGFNEHLTGCIDYELWLRIAHRRPMNVLCIPVVLTSYRRHSAQISADWRRMEREWHAMMHEMRELAPAETDEAMIDSQTNWYRYLSFVAYERGEPSAAATLLKQSVKANPAVALRNPRTLMLGAAIASNYLSRSLFR